MMSVCTSFAAADAMVKIQPPSMAIVRGHLRPLSSDTGAQIIGPAAKPNTYKVVPSVATSDPTLNSRLASSVPGANTALVNDTINVPLHTKTEMKSLIASLSQQVV